VVVSQSRSVVYDDELNSFSDTLKRAKEYVENEKIENALTGRYKSPIAIFDLKNNHGYKDTVEQHVHNHKPVIQDDIPEVDEQ
jgi:dihydroorotase-like cyclic amidohydrolase